MRSNLSFMKLLFLIFSLFSSCKKPANYTAVTPVPNTPVTLLASNLTHSTDTSETVILKSDSPWEVGSLYCYSVFQKDSIVSLYYTAGDINNTVHLCYAYSTDGVHFIKPNLGQTLFNGNKNNNIIDVNLVGTSFFYDSQSAYPYKIIGMAGDLKQHIAYSSDGIHFTVNPQAIVDYFCDSQNQIIYDAELKKYQYYLRNYVYDTTITNPVQGQSYYYRGVCYFDADTLQPIHITGTPITHPFAKTLVISTEFPTILNYNRKLGECDIYLSSIIKYTSGVYISYASIFHHFPPPPIGQYPNDGYSSIALYTSTDGKTFTLYAPNFINENPTTYHLATGFACENNMILNYYWKNFNTHGNENKVGEYVMRKYTIDSNLLTSIKAYNNIKSN